MKQTEISLKPPVTVFGPFSGLDLLSFGVLVLDAELRIVHLNPAAENLLQRSVASLSGRGLYQVVLRSPTLQSALDNALRNNWGYTGHNIGIQQEAEEPLKLDCTVTPIDLPNARLLLELRPIDTQLQVAKEEQLFAQQEAQRALIRNLAHEIKNPLGGIRGAAQLLELELNNPALHEYTQVIVKESDRLQDLMQRLLSPHRNLQPAPVNIHEILERVRSLLTAEFPDHLRVRRDYDTSLPELVADRERLIQAILNIARNAAQAMHGSGEIILRTRTARQVTLVKRRYKLAMDVQVIDNGPGIPEEIRERMFFPLVSGREGGSGLGLSLAQNFVQQHNGTIECSTRPGETCFTLRLPIVPGETPGLTPSA